MHEIHMADVSREFAACWQAAGRHLQRQAQGHLSWIKADLAPPFLEHLSFRMGNQLFFIRIEDVDGQVAAPGSIQGLQRIADECRGHACLFPIKRRPEGWVADFTGWGLIDAASNQPVVPPALVSDELIEMTDWEVQDFAVQIVRSSLEKQGRSIMSAQGSPHVDPSIWFVGDRGPEWIVVRSSRFPRPIPPPPQNIDAIAASCSRLSNIGHFAPVGVANADDPFHPEGDGALPLWRGHGLIARFAGVQPLGFG